MATVSIVMEYGSVKGESGLTQYPEWIVIDQIAHGGMWTRTSQIGTTEDATESTLQLTQITLTRTWDTSSFALFQTFTKGQPQKTVTINSVAGDGGKRQVALYKLSDVTITGWYMEQSASGSGSARETLTLTASKVTVTGFAYDDTGSQSYSVPVSYDYTKSEVI